MSLLLITKQEDTHLVTNSGLYLSRAGYSLWTAVFDNY